MADKPCPCPTICFRLDVYLHCLPCPPKGITPGKLKQAKGKNMAAEVQMPYTPDPDTNVNSTAVSWFIIPAGSPAGTPPTALGTVTYPSPPSGLASTADLSPAHAAFNLNDQISNSTITTDSFSQSSPAVPGPNTVTIQTVPPPPTGIVPGQLKQVGTP
jgi:hypothetical protein